MASPALLRVGFLCLVGLLCLLLVYQSFQVASSSHSRIHARDLEVSATAETWEDRNLTVSVASYRGLAARADLLNFETAVKKGSGLYCRCKAKWELSDDSDWATKSQLEDYWEKKPYKVDPASNVPTSAGWLKEALTGLNLPYQMSSGGDGKDGKLVGEIWFQSEDWTTELIANGKVTRTTHEATHGYYINVMSPQAGLIIAELNFSPAYMSGGQSPPL
ncbi:hypothetical protein AOCH_007048, partial [Aspergillus ochraceoroseus]